MKIAIIGYSGSGKSTLAKKLGEKYGCDVLHIDSVHFLPGWIEREKEDEQKIVSGFLDSRESWVTDGTYTKLSFERRMEEADMIVMMLFNRFSCLHRVVKRYKKYKNSTRPDAAEGCNEKLDREFITWVLWRGRKKKTRQRYKDLQKMYKEKAAVIKNQKQLVEFEKREGLPL